MKKLTIILAVFLLSVNAKAQIFQNVIGKASPMEYGLSISSAVDSSYLAGGIYTNQFWGTAFPFISKLKKDGSVAWAKQITIPGMPSVRSVYAATVQASATRTDGSIMIIDAWNYFYAVRLANDGSVSWARKISFGGYTISSGLKIYPSYNNIGTLTGFILVGNHYNWANGSFVMKLNPNGNILWNNALKHNVIDSKFVIRDMKTTNDGGCIVLANQEGTSPSLTALFKVNAAGAVTWSKTYRFDLNFGCFAAGIAVTSDANYAITGQLGTKNFTAKISAAGLILWANTYSSVSVPHLEGTAVTADLNGNIIVTGSVDDALAKPAFIIKYNMNGSVLFSNQYNRKNNEIFSDITFSKQGTYCAIGTTEQTNVNANMYVVSVSALGANGVGCLNQKITLSKTVTDLKIVGFSDFKTASDFLLPAAVNANTVDISTLQDKCAGQIVNGINSENESSGQLKIANDMQNQRILINWQMKEQAAGNYNAILLNSFGQKVTSVKINANQAVYMSMQNMHSGIYSVMIMQNETFAAQEKVIWAK